MCVQTHLVLIKFRRIVGGIFSSQPSGFLFQAFGRAKKFWSIVFGEQPIPAVPEEKTLERPRARSLGEAHEQLTGVFQLPTISTEEYSERADLRAKQFG